MRDKIKPDGLKEVVENLYTYVDFYKEDLNEPLSEDTRKNIELGLISTSVQKIVALYSFGSDKNEIKMAVADALEIIKNHFKWVGVELGYGDYDYMIWMVSLGILCEVELEEFQKITDVIKRDNAQDKLLDFIIKSKQEDWEREADHYIQAIPYAETSKIETEEDIKHYLDNVWYQGHDEASWHDLHKNKKANRYFGYWAWEVAAIAKIKGIDDESLKDHPFYPYDAVHW